MLTVLLVSTADTELLAAAASGAGYLLFWRGGSLMAQPFDATRLRLSGGPFPVADDSSRCMSMATVNRMICTFSIWLQAELPDSLTV